MPDLSVETYIPQPKARVWRALCDPAQLSAWYMQVEGFQAVEGARFVLRSRPNPFWKGVAYGCMLSVQAPDRIEWSQSDAAGEAPSFSLAFSLSDEAGGTRVRVDQRGLHGLKGRMIAAFMTSGWKRVLEERLSRHLAEERDFKD